MGKEDDESMQDEDEDVRDQQEKKEEHLFIEQFVPGDVCTVVSVATMRGAESLDSNFICDLAPGSHLVSLEIGQDRRMKVSTLHNELLGWISVRTRSGHPL